MTNLFATNLQLVVIIFISKSIQFPTKGAYGNSNIGVRWRFPLPKRNCPTGKKICNQFRPKNYKNFTVMYLIQKSI